MVEDNNSNNNNDAVKVGLHFRHLDIRIVKLLIPNYKLLMMVMMYRILDRKE